MHSARTNRTINPQIKSWGRASKTLERQRCIRRHIDRTLADLGVSLVAGGSQPLMPTALYLVAA